MAMCMYDICRLWIVITLCWKDIGGNSIEIDGVSSMRYTGTFAGFSHACGSMEIEGPLYQLGMMKEPRQWLPHPTLSASFMQGGDG